MMIRPVQFGASAQFVCRAKSQRRPDAAQNAEFFATQLRQSQPYEDILVVHDSTGHRAAVLIGGLDIDMLRTLQAQVGKKTTEIKGKDIRGGSPFSGAIRRLIGFAHVDGERFYEGDEPPVYSIKRKTKRKNS